LQAPHQYVSTGQFHGSPLVIGKKRPSGRGRVERVSINATAGRGKLPAPRGPHLGARRPPRPPWRPQATRRRAPNSNTVSIPADNPHRLVLGTGERAIFISDLHLGPAYPEIET